MINKKIIICSTVKNEEKNLPNFFSLINNIKSKFKDYFVCLVESDSNDKTLYFAKKKISDLKGVVINCSTKNIKFRTEKLAFCRNKYLDFVKNNKKLKKFDYLIVLDADNINNLLKIDKIIQTLMNAPKKWSALFANQKFIYYDIWPLRIKGFIDDDCYKRFIYDLNKLQPKESYKKNVSKLFYSIRHFKSRYIKVNSAFGGFGIYKLKDIIKLRYSSLNGKISEHVFLNMNLSQNKKNLYIDKELINSNGAFNEHYIKSLIYSYSNFFANKLSNQFKKIYYQKK